MKERKKMAEKGFFFNKLQNYHIPMHAISCHVSKNWHETC